MYEQKTWKLVLAFLFFCVPFVVLLVGVLAGFMPLASNGGAMLLLSGGFAVAMIPTLNSGWRRRAAESGPTPVMWVFFFAGVALWCAAPIAVLAAGQGWGAGVGSSSRALPVWLLAPLTWGTAALMLLGFIRQRRRIRRRRQG